ncbi:MAG: GDSL-type esterase/lipase family protein [Maribacter sp.]|nr:GDSL-type esterase/lipase family protein [Maribacter sp.]
MRFLLIAGLLVLNVLHAQDPLRFKEEVASIEKKYDTLWNPSEETIVFTGSSSIRIWHDLETRFPQYHIVNSGFGGSQASDLLAYSDVLIGRFNPKKVFIYEGDNDIAEGKRPKVILKEIQEIIAKIRAARPDTEIVLIAAKPSLARWKLRGKYRRLNRRFARLAKKDTMTTAADVWHPMLTGRKLKTDIFLEDGLHMNAKGYELWYGVLKKYVE